MTVDMRVVLEGLALGRALNFRFGRRSCRTLGGPNTRPRLRLIGPPGDLPGAISASRRSVNCRPDGVAGTVAPTP